MQSNYTWTILPSALSGAVLLITKKCTHPDSYQYARLYSQELVLSTVQHPRDMTEAQLRFLFEHADEYQLTPPRDTLFGCTKKNG